MKISMSKTGIYFSYKWEFKATAVSEHIWVRGFSGVTGTFSLLSPLSSALASFFSWDLCDSREATEKL